MDKKVKKTIEKYNLLHENSEIIVGVSGGADSISLLHYLWKNSNKYNWILHVVHINHGLRGLESLSDSDYVKSICEKWDIQYSIFDYDLKEESKKLKLGLEETGRVIRYKAFNEVSKKYNNPVIAVAHNQDDQAETVLMKLCRGANLKGLSGIKYKNQNIIRPLLGVSREEIEDYCNKNSLEYVVDSSNLENIYTRNKIRLEVLPLLEKIYGKPKYHIAKTAYYVGEEDEFLSSLAQKLYNESLVSDNINSNNKEIIFAKDKLYNSEKVLVRRVIYKCFENMQLTKNFTSTHIEIIMDLIYSNNMKEISLPKNIYAVTSYNTICFYSKENKIKKENSNFSYRIELEKDYYIEEINKYLKIYTSEIKKNIINDYTKVLDYDKIIKEVNKIGNIQFKCRTREIGDLFPIGNGHKKLKDYFIDNKIDKNIRDKIFLIAIDSTILYIENRDIFTYFKADINTKNYLYIEFKEEI